MNFTSPLTWKINDVSTWLKTFIPNEEIIIQFQSEPNKVKKRSFFLLTYNCFSKFYLFIYFLNRNLKGSPNYYVSGKIDFQEIK